MFLLQAYYLCRPHVCVGPPQYDQLNAKATDFMEQDCFYVMLLPIQNAGEMKINLQISESQCLSYLINLIIDWTSVTLL